MRKLRVISLQDLEADLEKHLSARELQYLLPLDLLVRGRLRDVDTPTELLLAVEVSAVVDAGDVERALRRTKLLRKAGFRVVAAAAGEDVTEGGDTLARTASVLLVQNGSRAYWETALADALAV